MHFPPELPESEELSFGGDSDRESWLGGWLRAHLKRVAVVAFSVLLVAGLGAGGWRLYENSRQPLPPPDGPWPETGTFSVYLCEEHDVWEGCRNRGSATADERQALEAVLRTTPEVAKFKFETRAEAFANFQKAGLPDAAEETSRERFGPENITAADMPESYRGTLTSGDWRTLVQRLKALPGVSNVYVVRDSFWQGKADLSITLCPQVSRWIERCKGRGAATDSEKRAVLNRIRTLPGVEAIFFEDRAQYLKELRHMWWQGDMSSVNVSHSPEAFYVRFGQPPVMRDIEKAFAGMAGVAEVSEVSGS